MPATRIALAHPGPAPFVQQVGRALYEAGMLLRFATTFVDRPDALWRNVLCRMADLTGQDLKRQLRRRAITEFPLEKVVSKPGAEILRTLASRWDKDGRLTDCIWEWAEKRFDQWVAGHALQNADVVYGYEHACLNTFQSAQRRGILRVYEVPAPHHAFVKDIFEQEFAKYPELRTPYYEHLHKHQEQRTARCMQEWELADLVIVNSELTRRSFASNGADIDKVRVLPLGAPPIRGIGKNGGTATSEPIRFLWAGTFSMRKGAHYVLQAWERLRPGRAARLDIVGAVRLPASMLQRVPESVQFFNSVPRDELFELYHRADALVFPTLCDGFGMVVTEALAQGLPVITTACAGASDLIKQHVNGLIIPSAEVDGLTTALDWCIDNRQALKSMRIAAIDTAAHWQWADFRQALVQNLVAGLNTKPPSL